MKRLSWPALVALAALAPHPEARSQAGPSPVVIRGCSVLDVAGGRMIAGRTVVLDGGKIHAVAAPGDPVETPAGATTIAAEGKFLIPGLIDAHVHLVHVLDSCRVTGDEVLPLFVAAGVTSVRDVGDEIVAETLVARAAEASPEKAPRVFRCSPLIDREPPFHRDIGFALTDVAAVPGFVDEMAGWGVTTLKIYVGTPREIGRAVIADGHRRGLRVTGHLGAYTAQDAVADGIDALEHIWSVFNFIIPPEEAKRPDHRSTLDLDNPRAKALVAALAERRTFVDPTLVVFRNMILLNDQAAYSGHPDNAVVPARLLRHWESYKARSNLRPETLAARRAEFGKYRQLSGILRRACRCSPAPTRPSRSSPRAPRCTRSWSCSSSPASRRPRRCGVRRCTTRRPSGRPTGSGRSSAASSRTSSCSTRTPSIRSPIRARSRRCSAAAWSSTRATCGRPSRRTDRADRGESPLRS